MRGWSLRRKLALYSALATAVALLTFGIAAGINLAMERNEHRGEHEESPEDTLDELLEAYLLSLPVVVVVVAAGGWWIAGRALKPISTITEEAAAITADRLDRRLAVPESNDEIGRHIRTLNAMFDRLQSSFEQATRFSADASHELRTPLTILRGEVEAALSRGGLAPETETLLGSILDQVSALQQIAGNLLLLSRFDEGKVPLEASPVNVSALMEEAYEDAELLASASAITVERSIAQGLWVRADSSLLKRALLNLIDNAVRYNRPGGTLSLSLVATGSEATLSCFNTGPSIPADKQDLLFRRFSRIEGDRNRQTGGSGLGLSLCREIAVAHGGSARLAHSGPDGNRFELVLPLVAAPVAPA